MKRKLTCTNYFIILEKKIFKRAHQMQMFGLAKTSHFEKKIFKRAHQMQMFGLAKTSHFEKLCHIDTVYSTVMTMYLPGAILYSNVL